MVRSPGFEPGSSAWQADVLAKLDYDRFWWTTYSCGCLLKSVMLCGSVCIVFCRMLWFFIWYRWVLHLQSELPKLAMAWAFWLMDAAILHSSVLFAFL